VALARDMPAAIGEVLHEPETPIAGGAATTAVFYSISNCQEGLRGISFGNFLLKQVVEELEREVPSLKTFVTLSPMPRFARWLAETAAGTDDVASDASTALSTVQRLGGFETVGEAADAQLKTSLLALAAQYFLVAKAADGRAVDPVARFHLGNGARLERINWMADPSLKGLRDAFGLMVNYRYDPKEIEKNHEAYANEGTIAASRAVRALLKARAKAKPVVADPAEHAALPAPTAEKATL
jgi:malonyl-CoA decarboxylase